MIRLGESVPIVLTVLAQDSRSKYGSKTHMSTLIGALLLSELSRDLCLRANSSSSTTYLECPCTEEITEGGSRDIVPLTNLTKISCRELISLELNSAVAKNTYPL